MVPAVKSKMTLSVNVDNNIGDIEVYDKGSEIDLSEKYEFKIVNPHLWNLTGIVGRRCAVNEVSGTYNFVEYIE